MGICILCETRLKGNNINKFMGNGLGDLSFISNHDTHPGGRVVILWDPDLVSLRVKFSSA